MDKQVIIDTIAQFRSALLSREPMDEATIHDLANAALNEVRKSGAPPAPIETP